MPRNKGDDIEQGQLQHNNELGLLPFDAPKAPRPAPVELPPHARGAPSTSQAAAGQKAPTAQAQRELVFDALARRGAWGATAEELAELLKLSGDSIRPRLWELRGENRKRPDLPPRVKPSGSSRATRTGRQAVVWIAWAPAPD